MSVFDTFVVLIQPRRYFLLEWGNQFYLAHHHGQQRSCGVNCDEPLLERRVTGCEQGRQYCLICVFVRSPRLRYSVTNSCFSATKASSTSSTPNGAVATSIQYGVAGIVGAAVAAVFV